MLRECKGSLDNRVCVGMIVVWLKDYLYKASLFLFTKSIFLGLTLEISDGLLSLCYYCRVSATCNGVTKLNLFGSTGVTMLALES